MSVGVVLLLQVVDLVVRVAVEVVAVPIVVVVVVVVSILLVIHAIAIVSILLAVDCVQEAVGRDGRARGRGRVGQRWRRDLVVIVVLHLLVLLVLLGSLCVDTGVDVGSVVVAVHVVELLLAFVFIGDQGVGVFGGDGAFAK